MFSGFIVDFRGMLRYLSYFYDEVFAKIVGSFLPLTVFAKRFIIDFLKELK